jgi:hypothetical protein
MFAFGFFTLRSLRSVVLPDSVGEDAANEVGNLPQRKKRVWFLFVVALLETLTAFLMI